MTGTFTKDCCDREFLAFWAWEKKGLMGEPVREMLTETVEKRFGDIDGIPKTHTLESSRKTAARTSRPRPGTSFDN